MTTSVRKITENNRLIAAARAPFTGATIKELFVEPTSRSAKLKASIWYMAANALSKLCEAMGINDMEPQKINQTVASFEPFLNGITEKSDINWEMRRQKISSAMFWYYLSLGRVRLYCKEVVANSIKWKEVIHIEPRDGRWQLNDDSFDLSYHANLNPFDVFRIADSSFIVRDNNTTLSMQEPRDKFVMMAQTNLRDNMRQLNYALVINRTESIDPGAWCARD